MRVKQTITAANCIIEMPTGHEVGYLQNLTINANYDLLPVRNLYQHTIQNYAQGVAQYTVSAQRAFVEMDSFFGDQRAIVQLVEKLQDLGNQQNSGTTSGDQLTQAIADVGAVIKAGATIFKQITDSSGGNLLDRSRELLVGNTNIGDLFSMFEFDIRVANPIVQYPEGDVEKASRLVDILTTNRNDLFMLRGCRVASRNITINIDNVAVMEGLDIFAKQLEDAIFRGSPNT